jgi:hypothetical protein
MRNFPSKGAQERAEGVIERFARQVARGRNGCERPWLVLRTTHEGPARAQASLPQPRAVPEPRFADGFDACVDSRCGGPTGSLRRFRGHGQPATHKQRVAE